MKYMVLLNFIYKEDDPRNDAVAQRMQSDLSNMPEIEQVMLYRQVHKENRFHYALEIIFRKPEDLNAFKNNLLYTDFVKNIWQREVAEWEEADLKDYL